MSMDAHTMYWECLQGKQRHLRAGFLWSCPRYNIVEDLDFGAWFLEALSNRLAPTDIECVGFNTSTAAEMPPRSIRSMVSWRWRAPGDADKVSSKSWRKLPVTLFWPGFDTTRFCALGNWLDTAATGCNVTHGGIIKPSRPRPSPGLPRTQLQCELRSHDRRRR